ncbi:hypothetical protein FQA39_LY08290 [Lamprigera yunnana]|nr:hypothetical protein FQA39_LY08290 [Lamprigera yunnana]
MDISELSNKLICEKHFIPTDININNKRKLLNKNAVPVKYVEPIISVQGTIKTYGQKRKTHIKENTENSFEEDEETLDILVQSSEADVTTFFKFPVKDFQRTAEWQKNCGNSNVVLMDISELSNKLICEKHFIPTDININNKRKLLNKNAVPVKYVEPIISVQGTIKTYGQKRKTHIKENTENSFEEDEETLDILVQSSEAGNIPITISFMLIRLETETYVVQST